MRQTLINNFEDTTDVYPFYQQFYLSVSIRVTFFLHRQLVFALEKNLLKTNGLKIKPAVTNYYFEPHITLSTDIALNG